MFTFHLDSSYQSKNLPFGVLEVTYSDPAQWDLPAFEALKEQELAAIREEFADYDRKAVFGENPYNRYFKKYKKTYPVLQQLESVLLKGRPFPSGQPINEVAFLAELRTQVLAGTHDIDRIQGTAELFCPTEKLPFTGMRGEEIHCYPGDCTGRDNGGIILSMIAGADDRTCLQPNSRHVAYLVFSAPEATEEMVSSMLDILAKYAGTLAPTAEICRVVL